MQTNSVQRHLPYDRKYLVRCLLGLAAMVVLMKATGGSGFVIMLPLMLVAALQRKTETLLFLLVVTIAVTIGNGALMPKNSLFGYAQRASMVLIGGVMALQVAGQRGSPLTRPFLLLFPYLLYMVLPSAFGWCPFISYLKLFLFSMIFLAYYGVATSVSQARSDNVRRIRSIFLALAIFFIFGSTLLIPFPGIGQMRADEYLAALRSGVQLTSLFCGMTFHSQSLGPVTAMLGVALFADLVFGVRRADKLYVALLLCVPILLWKTSSRTAMGSFIAGMGVCVYGVMLARGLRSGWKAKILNVAFATGIGLLVAVLVVPSIRGKAVRFAVKAAGAEEDISGATTQDVFKSRLGKWDEGIYNFKKSPALGNGFQVSPEMIGLRPSMQVLSAPVEKSVWVAAVLEEGGVFGFLIFLFFALGVIMTLKRKRAHIGLACFAVFLVINLGEFTMFSMSGIGGVCWALVFIGVMMDSRRMRAEQLERQRLMAPPPPPWGWR